MEFIKKSMKKKKKKKDPKKGNTKKSIEITKENIESIGIIENIGIMIGNIETIIVKKIENIETMVEIMIKKKDIKFF